MALGLEWTSLRRLRRATTVKQVREWLGISAGAGPVGMVSMLTLLASGVYMTATVWGWVAWIIVTLGTLVLLVLLTVMLSGRRLAVIGQAVTTETGTVSPRLHQLLHHPLLWIVIQTRVAVALGIVFLMTVKPGLEGSLLTIGVAALLGLALALSMRGREQAQEKP